ncbi:xanthine dehydrogenase family protein molybdopterin-binding subunit [Roseicyclus mahoneyensis]|uniref:Carbon-monoxide dehydrogenase large subunit n=1 Tax=Roseicyclus mahoneyensis TaxID=164332 RepID=A0A316GH14_9RHOB|nr:xanthine dehydrogenase family protein molybdopterin-binding subunit [Roseicyclus mahoneyensis]PWK60287.1 carbon-monoxide dehydrogenase large subunit [Roseicyclus mahoneyensis]
MSVIGRALPRFEDDTLLRGAGRYAGDLAPEGMAHLVFLRSPVAAGRIMRLDASGVAAMPGVLAVIDAATLAGAGIAALPAPALPAHLARGPVHAPTFPVLAQDAVHHVGQPILAIVAETAAAAQDALEAVILDIEDRPVMADLAQAGDGPAVWDSATGNRIFRVEMGDAAATEAALSGAAHRITRRLSISRVTAAPMEPRGALGEWDESSGRYTLSLGTQAAHRLGDGMRALMGLPEGALRVRSVLCGGSFGMRNGAMPEFAPVLLAARLTGRPVRWVETRSEAFLADPQARDQIVEATLGLDAAGRFVGLSVAVTAGIGAFAGPSSLMSSFNNLPSVAGVYRLPAIHATVEGVHLNTQTVAAYRGAGRPEAAYVIERMIDIAAREIGIDRVDLRRRNMLRAEELPHRTALGYTYDSGDFPAVLDRALAAGDWAGFAARRAEAAARGRLRGIGLACTIEIAGGPAMTPMPEYAAVTLTAEGCTLRLGTGDAGQGHGTAFAQIAAEALGIGMDHIRLIAGDTDLVARATGTFGSRSIGAAGSALWHACGDAIDQLRVHAARHLEAAALDITFADGTFRVPGTNRAVTLEALLTAEDLTIEAERWEATKGPSYPNGAHIAEVEIDPETGALILSRYLAVEDIGRVINPLLAHGQLHGGVAQGAGQALMEAIVFDPGSGQLLSGSFMDYAMPRASDLPFIDVAAMPAPTTSNALGTKGAGEAGTVGALPALASAIADALAPLGIGHVDMPATPAAIWQAIRDAEVTSSAAC